MNDENLIINNSNVNELKQDYPQEMEIIIKMLTEVSERGHLETNQLKVLVAL
jgi:transcriptional antiterminator